MRKFFLLAVILLTVAGNAISAETTTKTVTLAVDNMTCSACPITVRNALEKVPGVSKTKVDLDHHTATVTFDPAKAKIEDLTSATTNAGYPSKPVP